MFHDSWADTAEILVAVAVAAVAVAAVVDTAGRSQKSQHVTLRAIRRSIFGLLAEAVCIVASVATVSAEKECAYDSVSKSNHTRFLPLVAWS